jgi:hypothetical protein
MNSILGLDLGKFKSVACLYDPQTTAARFTTVDSHPADLRPLLQAERPAFVVFETCTSPAGSPTCVRNWASSSPSPTRCTRPGPDARPGRGWVRGRATAVTDKFLTETGSIESP